MKVVLDNGALLPTRAHPLDAGLDMYTPVECVIPARGSAIIDTGVHIAIPPFYVGFVKSKSGLYMKHNLTVDGTVDSGYTGSIRVKVCNHGDTDYEFKSGDKIAQLVVVPIGLSDLEITSSLEHTERGDNGFGSTGYNIADNKV